MLKADSKGRLCFLVGTSTFADRKNKRCNAAAKIVIPGLCLLRLFLCSGRGELGSRPDFVYQLKLLRGRKLGHYLKKYWGGYVLSCVALWRLFGLTGVLVFQSATAVVFVLGLGFRNTDNSSWDGLESGNCRHVMILFWSKRFVHRIQKNMVMLYDYEPHSR